MSNFLFALLGLGLVNSAVSASAARLCTELTLSVPVNATNSVYNISKADDNISLIDVVDELTRWTTNLTTLVESPLPVQQSFNISAQLCVPQKSSKANILQIATHGGGFNKIYWDSKFQPERYSYVDAAVNAGYSILTYDRLGTGKSDHPDAYDVVQGPVHIEILKGLVTLARAGLNVSSNDLQGASVPAFDKVVVVGHSIGSLYTLGFLTKHGELVDGAVSTALIPGSNVGMASQQAFGWNYAPTDSSHQFWDRGSGYIVQETVNSLQTIFFKKGAFDTAALTYGASIKDTATIGETVSFGAVLSQPGPNFVGPLLFALAEYDAAVCGGYCPGSYDPAASKQLFPNATDLSVHIQPGSGHALTLHTNATGHYQVIFNYLQDHGL